MSDTSTKPYLLRALYEWCTDNGFTPHIAVRVDTRTRVPTQFVRDGEIVLNISFDATSSLQMKNDWIEFSARFGGKAYKIEVPVSNVLAIYARENGQGMAFPVEETVESHSDVPGAEVMDDESAEELAEGRDHTDVGTKEVGKGALLSSVPSGERRSEPMLKSIDGDGAGDGEPAAVIDNGDASTDAASTNGQDSGKSDGEPPHDGDDTPKSPTRPHLKVVK